MPPGPGGNAGTSGLPVVVLLLAVAVIATIAIRRAAAQYRRRLYRDDR